MTGHLLRSLAPIPDAAWQAVDAEAKERLSPHLGARRVVDFSGPTVGHTMRPTSVVPGSWPTRRDWSPREGSPCGNVECCH